MTGFNWFDVLLLLLVVWSILAGLRAGFARMVIGLIASVAAFMTGFWFYRPLAAKLMPIVNNEATADVLGFLLLFVGVLILGSLVTALIARLFHWIGLSWFNHLLGGVAGFVRGVFVIVALVDVAIAFAPSPLPEAIVQSRVVPYAGELAQWMADLAPRDLRDAFTERMENLRQLWQKTPPKTPRKAQTA